MIASAGDIVKKGFNYEVVNIRGLEVELRGMTVDEALRLSKYAKSQNDKMLVFAYLIKQCCSAFDSWWWTPGRIKKKLSVKMLLEIADKIMILSGYKEDSIDTSLKE